MSEIQNQYQTQPEQKETNLSEKVVGNFTKAELATLQSTIAKGTTKEQFNLFIQICVNSGLNPFLNHVYCITYNSKGGTVMSVQIAVEGILYLARQQPGYKGVEAQLVHENDEFRLGRVDGKLTVTMHDIGFPRGQIVGGYAIAKREGFDDVLVIMEANEVEHMKKGRNSDMWNNYFQDMFKKHMLKRAAKTQYGIEINEDMPYESDPTGFQEYKPGERKEVTEEEPMVSVGEEETYTESELMQQQWDLISAHMKTYNLQKSEITKIVKEKFNKKVDSLSLQDLVALSKFVEFEGKQKPKQKKEEKNPMNNGIIDLGEAESLFA